jgi:hypothetical protein
MVFAMKNPKAKNLGLQSIQIPNDFSQFPSNTFHFCPKFEPSPYVDDDSFTASPTAFDIGFALLGKR